MFLMKKLILALAVVVVLGTAAQAQQMNPEALRQKIEKNEAAAADAKKTLKASTWINLAKSYIDAVIAPTTGLYVGMPALVLQANEAPKSIEEVTISNNVTMAALHFNFHTVYVFDGQVIGWKEATPIQENAIDKALEALDKAYELDPNQAPKIKEQLSRISNYCSQIGDASNGISEYKIGSQAFETAFRAESRPAYGTPDASRLYYAGYLATAAGESDPAEFARGVDMLNKALEMGFTDDQGQIYYYLFHGYYGQREADKANVQKAKDVLMAGISKFPKNQDILKSLILLYSMEEGMGNPKELITMLDEAIANDPQNIELWFSRAQIFVSMKEYDEAIASLQKAIELNPQSYEAQFFSGYYIIMKADALNTAANQKQYTSIEESDADQKEILAVYAQAIPYLEAAHEINPKNADPLQLLKTLCYRLRDTEGMAAKYEKYDALFKQLS